MERFSLGQCALWRCNDLILINFKLKIGEYFHVISKIWPLISAISLIRLKSLFITL
jgi:hypothetical protein